MCAFFWLQYAANCCWDPPLSIPSTMNWSKTCWLTAKSSAPLCVCVQKKSVFSVRVLLLPPVCIPAFIKYVITHIRALLINKQTLFSFFILSFIVVYVQQRAGRGEDPAESGVKRREAGRQDRWRVMKIADKSHGREFLGWETKSATACPTRCSEDGWNKGGRKDGTEADEWCERSVACWSIHERCREQKVDVITDRYYFAFSSVGRIIVTDIRWPNGHH